MTDDEIKNMKGTFKDLGFQVINIDVGDEVYCDLCNKSFTESDEKGGFLFSSQAVCPYCAPEFEERAKKFNEEKYISDRAKPNESFRSFVYRIR